MRAFHLINALAYLAVLVAMQFGWDGKWLFLPILATGVGAVLEALRNREVRQLDAPATLNLRR